MKIRSNSKPADQPEAGTHVGRLVGFVDMGHMTLKVLSYAS